MFFDCISCFKRFENVQLPKLKHILFTRLAGCFSKSPETSDDFYKNFENEKTVFTILQFFVLVMMGGKTKV